LNKANIGVFSALRDELDWVLQDKLNHASLIDANHLIGLPLQRYLHNDMIALEKKIAKQSAPTPNLSTPCLKACLIFGCLASDR
jgi:8-amino-7-oxononanoate synthase